MHTAILQSLTTDQAAFSEWLAKLNTQNGLAASNELYRFIAALRKDSGNIDPSILQQMAMQLVPMALYLSDFLEKSYLDKITPRIAQLNIQLMRQLAALHLRAAETADDHRKAEHYNYAIQMQGIGHYLSVLSYDRPSSSIWSEMGSAYRGALEQHMIDQASHNQIPALQKLDTIEKAIKRNLLFAACNAYRLPRNAIQALFKFCNEHYAHLELNRLGTVSNEGFCWPHTTKQLPYPIKLSTEGKHGLIFNVDPLIKIHRQGQIQWPIADPTLLLNTLTNYRNLISSPLTALPNNHVFISEFERVATFFKAHIRSGLVWTMNSPTPEHLNFSSLELKPDNAEEKERVSHEEIWGRPKDEPLKLASTDFGALKTIKTGVPAFFVCEAIRAKLKDQDLLTLYGKDLKPYLAIVRRLEPGKSSHIQKALIEILPGDVKPVSILDEKYPSEAILLRQQELFLPPEKYTTGGTLQTNIGLLPLERLLEVSPHYMRYQIGSTNGT